jgi:hypothetical protein
MSSTITGNEIAKGSTITSLSRSLPTRTAGVLSSAGNAWVGSSATIAPMPHSLPSVELWHSTRSDREPELTAEPEPANDPPSRQTIPSTRADAEGPGDSGAELR